MLLGCGERSCITSLFCQKTKTIKIESGRTFTPQCDRLAGNWKRAMGRKRLSLRLSRWGFSNICLGFFQVYPFLLTHQFVLEFFSACFLFSTCISIIVCHTSNMCIVAVLFKTDKGCPNLGLSSMICLAQVKLDSMNSEVGVGWIMRRPCVVWICVMFCRILFSMSLYVHAFYMQKRNRCCWCFFWVDGESCLGFFVSLKMFSLNWAALFLGFGQLEMQNMVTVVDKLHQCIVLHRRIEMKVLQWKTTSLFLGPNR